MHDYLEQLRRKPEAERTRIAFFSSAAVTGVIALGWMVALVTGGALTLSPNTPVALEEERETYNSLQAAVGAIGSTESASSGLVIVEEGTSTTIKEEAPEDATVIPF